MPVYEKFTESSRLHRNLKQQHVAPSKVFLSYHNLVRTLATTSHNQSGVDSNPDQWKTSRPHSPHSNTTNYNCEIHCLELDGFNLSTVHKLGSEEKNIGGGRVSNPGLLSGKQ